MDISITELKDKALESLHGKWGAVIGTYVVFILLSVVVRMVPAIGAIASLAITGPLTLGISIFMLHIARNQDADSNLLFKGFEQFGNALGAYLLMLIFVLLWTLLLIIPGIIASISYSMTFFIMADDESISPMDALKKSREMMNGYKWKYFLLQLSFIGWAILCILTLGIGFLWLGPYIYVTNAKFYEHVKEAYANPNKFLKA